MKWLTLLAVLFLVGCGNGSKSSMSVHPAPSPSVSSGAMAPVTILKPDPSTQLTVLQTYGKLPLAFEENRGQVDPRVKFVSRGAGYSLFLTADEAVLSVSDKVAQRPRPSQASTDSHLSIRKSERLARNINLNMKLVGSDPHTMVKGVDELPSKSNFFIGNDPKKWQTNLSNYAKVKYADVYPGVDLIYYGNQGKLEYDFVVAPGADPNVIRFNMAADHTSATTHRPAPTRITADGDLMVKVDGREIGLHKPIAYQTNGSGAKEYVKAEYVLEREHSQIRLAVASYDRDRALVIDPVLSYSTYLGPSGGINGIAVDAAGNAYVAGGNTWSGFPTTPGAFQATCPGGCAQGGYAFVSKLNSSGSALVYSTYLSGTTGDFAQSIAVDSAGNAFVTGEASSADFPVTNGAFQTACHSCGVIGGGNAFVTKLNASGSALVYSTFLGGSASEEGVGIALDAADNAYVGGYTNSIDFPVTPGSFQPTFETGSDAFVTKLNAQGSALVYSTYLGGNIGWGGLIAVNSAGNAYVTGSTTSPSFPTTPGAFATTCNNCGPGNGPSGHGLDDVFVTEFNLDGSALVYSTFVGGSDADGATGIALDASGNAYVTGYTYSNNFPTTPGAFQTTCGGGTCGGQLADMFLFKLNPTGSALVYSTLVGGSSYDYGESVVVDGSGDAYAAGGTISTDFPVTSAAFQSHCNTCTLTNYSSDAFVLEMNPSGSALLYSTYLGGSGSDGANGIAIDTSGNVYAAGVARSTDFPTTVGAFQPTASTSTAGSFVAKFAFGSTQSGPAANVTPTNLNFGSLVIGTVSGSQSITLDNNGTAAVTISSITISGTNNSDFTQTNNCGTSVAANTSCTINVTFKPSATGTRSASVTVTDSASGSPHSVSLTGIGTDFSLAAGTGANCPTGGNCSTSTVITAGQSATYNLQVSPDSGFNGTVTLSCSGAPSPSTCSVSPTSVPPNGTSNYSFTVTVANTSGVAVTPFLQPRDTMRPRTLPLGLLILALVLALMLLTRWVSPDRRPKYVLVPIWGLFLLCLTYTGGCSGLHTVHNQKQPVNATLTITGSSSSVSHNLSLSLTVNP